MLMIKLAIQCCYCVLLLCVGNIEYRSDRDDGFRVEYRILAVDEARDKTHVNVRISVDNPLSADQIKRLVCRVISEQKPSNSRVLRIFIYLKLDRFFADVVPNPANRIAYSHAMAAYFWNPRLSPAGKLQVYKDDCGMDYTRRPHSLNFDHSKECDQSKK